MWTGGAVTLTQTNVAVKHVQDAQALLQLISTAFTVTPLRHLHAAIAHVVRCHDRTCQQIERQRYEWERWYTEGIDIRNERQRDEWWPHQSDLHLGDSAARPALGFNHVNTCSNIISRLGDTSLTNFIKVPDVLVVQVHVTLGFSTSPWGCRDIFLITDLL